MSVASLELCRELHELSGWDGTLAVYEQTAGIPIGEPYIAYPELEKRWGLWGTQEFKVQTPAYDAGYLLRKLPHFVPSKVYEGKHADLWLRKDYAMDTGEDKYLAWYFVNGIQDVESDFGESGDTPEDALCKLAIELFKSNVLVKGLKMNRTYDKYPTPKKEEL